MTDSMQVNLRKNGFGNIEVNVNRRMDNVPVDIISDVVGVEKVKTSFLGDVYRYMVEVRTGSAFSTGAVIADVIATLAKHFNDDIKDVVVLGDKGNVDLVQKTRSAIEMMARPPFEVKVSVPDTPENRRAAAAFLRNVGTDSAERMAQFIDKVAND